jgi:hypothetical protein
MRRRWFGALVALSLSLTLACARRAPTQLLVRVESDLVAGTDLLGVRIAIQRESADRPLFDQDFPLGGAAPMFFLPGEVVFTAYDPNDVRRIIVTVTGRLGDASTLSQRAIVTRLEPGQVLRLEMYLAAGCRGVTCPPEQTCGRNGCEPEESVSRDGGAPDAGGSGNCEENCGPGTRCHNGYCQTLNDECEGAYPLRVNPGQATTVTGIFRNHAQPSVESCTPATDMFYSFVLTEPEVVTLIATPRQGRPAPTIGILHGECLTGASGASDGGSGVTCSSPDSACGASARVTRVLGPGRHIIVVDNGFDPVDVTDADGFALALYHVPVVDLHGEALAAGAFDAPGDFTGGTAGGACGAGAGAPRRWYYWSSCDGDRGGPLTVDSCGATGVGLQLRNSDGTAGTCGGCPFGATVPAGPGVHVLEATAGAGGAMSYVLRGMRP